MNVDVDEEIAALKRELRVASDSELAALLGLQRSAVAQWKKRGRVPNKAKLRAAAHASSIEANIASGALADTLPLGMKVLSRALVLKYIHETATSRDFGADGFIMRAALIDQLTVAAHDMLRAAMLSHCNDPERAYVSLFNDKNIEAGFAKVVLG